MPKTLLPPGFTTIINQRAFDRCSVNMVKEANKVAPPEGAEGNLDPTRGFFNKLTFAWMAKHVRTARQGKELNPEEMLMPPDNGAHAAYAKFSANWQAELAFKESVDGQGKKPSLTRALRKTFGTYYALAGVCKLLWSTFVITGAFFFVRRCGDAPSALLRAQSAPAVSALFLLAAWEVGPRRWIMRTRV